MKTQDTGLHDVRTVERNIELGLLTRAEHLKHLKSLPDVASKGEPMREPDGKKP